MVGEGSHATPALEPDPIEKGDFMATATTPDLSKLKGPATICRMCKNFTLPLPLRTYCKFCLTSGWVSLCLPCNGSGKIGAQDAWGGNSLHRSTCNTCGGVGLIPARAPAESATEEGVVTMPNDSPDGAEVTELVKEAKDVKPSEQPKVESPVTEGTKKPEVIPTS
jgi:hypothetical protein